MTRAAGPSSIAIVLPGATAAHFAGVPVTLHRELIQIVYTDSESPCEYDWKRYRRSLRKP